MSAPTYAEPTLDLFPDEADVELPFADGGEAPEEAPASTIARLRRALVDALAHVEAGTPAPGSRIRAWRELAGTTYVDGMTPTERAADGTTRAAARWTEAEVAAVDRAIVVVAARALDTAEALRVRLGASGRATNAAGMFPEELTTADVWAELGDGFPVTKGIAGRMLAAKAAGIIANTGRTVIIDPDAAGPNHGQRLTVWRAL